jgi:cob(I)alamin adenosyltransferase
MSITTKIGDKGQTRLYSGETVNKRSRRICVCGDIDELVSILGVAKYEINTLSKALNSLHLYGENSDSNNRIEDLIFIGEELEYIQKQLFILASDVATTDKSRLKKRIDTLSVNELDTKRIELENRIKLPEDFILPGSSLSCYLDLSRSVCRRVEREIVGLYNEGLLENFNILVWMNRLSDHLYLLARFFENNQYILVKGKNEF